MFVRAAVRLVIGALSLFVAAACSDDGSDASSPTTRSGTISASNAPDCAVSGEDIAFVPDVIGETLSDATDIVEDTGLNVVDDGVPSGDPIGDAATVTAQEPPGGAYVPIGSCVGFRTSDGPGVARDERGCPTTVPDTLVEVDSETLTGAIRLALGDDTVGFEVVESYPAESPAPVGADFAGLPESQCGRGIADRTLVVETRMTSADEGPSLTNVQWFVSRFDGQWVAWGNY